MLTLDDVKAALANLQEPELKKSLLSLGMVRGISIIEGRIKLTLALTTSRCPRKNQMIGEIRSALENLPKVSEVLIETTTLSQDELNELFPVHPLQGLAKVRHVVAVASGKGGVGKTTIAVNTALALAGEGQQVGLLDADVYGPSVPVMLDLTATPVWENKRLLPVEKFGLKIMSLGMLVKKEEAFIWRGPMVGKAIHQLLEQVLWGELDFLVVDLPPGTGDPSITVAQSIPNASILMVTTPQEVALADVRRAVELFRKFDLKIIGLVENMSFFMCGHDSVPIEIFGRGGGARLSEELDLPLLGTVPIELGIREGGDSGVPVMMSATDSQAKEVIHQIALQILAKAE